MNNVREILRQKWALRRSHREVAASLGISLGAISETVTKAGRAGLDWQRVEELTDRELTLAVYDAPETKRRALPDFAEVHIERQRRGVTLELLHHEYLEEHADGYRYTQFCEYYRRWCRKRRLSMRQVHRAGERMFVDYSGKKPSIIDAASGEQREVELFVAVLGASSYTYAEAALTQRSADFIASHTRALEFFGGAAELTIPDQLRSAVAKPCRYEPELQRTYQDWATHYATTVMPARPRKPRDKAKVEVAVQVVQRWILARIRNEKFFSLAALNRRIAELVADLNGRIMRGYGRSRRELFIAIDQPALRRLPAQRFQYAPWKKARVNIDYHIDLEGHYYSVPYQLAGELVEVRYTASVVEIFHGGQRLASHRRSYRRGKHTTIPEHMPKAHRKHMQWSPSRLIHWAGTIGPKTKELVEAILEARRHPEQGYRSCLGVLRLSKTYDRDRLEAACERAVAVRARSYRHVAAILKNGLDREPLEQTSTSGANRIDDHENLRGHRYYSKQEERKCS